MTDYDVTIIGAGITGAMAARELARYDLKLCILDAASDVAMGATKANSAIVHAGFDAKEGVSLLTNDKDKDSKKNPI